MIQQKFSFPVACLVLALIGLGLGVSNRKDGKLASFVLGFGVIFVYYVVLWTCALAGQVGLALSPSSGAVGAEHRAGRRRRSCCSSWRARSADQPIRFSDSGVLAPPAAPDGRRRSAHAARRAAPRGRGGAACRTSNLPRPNAARPVRLARST